MIKETDMFVIGSEHFTWDKASLLFSADISSLQQTEFGNAELDRREINGHTEYGFWMKSARTGKELWFRLAGTQRDDDCDIMWWTYKAYNRYNDSFLWLRIYND